MNDTEDDDIMQGNAEDLRDVVVGHRIVSAERKEWSLELTLDNGKRVRLADTDDCCAYTYLDGFLLRADSVDHIITDVTTKDGYTQWHILADMEDVLQLDVSWSEGSGYYGYGFHITVKDAE